MPSRRAFILLLSIFALILTGGFAPAKEDKGDKKPTSTTPKEKDPKRHEEFLKAKEEQLKKGPIQVVFIGDSITDKWRRAGKKVWDASYEKYNALNLGISGDKTENVLWRVQNGELDGLDPKVVVLMIGTNNIFSSSSDVAAGITADVEAIHEKLPQAKILLLGVFPRDPKPTDSVRRRIKSVNADIAELDGKNNVKFLDIGPKFLDADGFMSKEIMADGLHPTEKGYGIWAEAIQPTLDEMMK